MNEFNNLGSFSSSSSAEEGLRDGQRDQINSGFLKMKNLDELRT